MLPNVAFHELVVITRRQEKVMEFNKMCFPKEENDRKGKKGISGWRQKNLEGLVNKDGLD